MMIPYLINGEETYIQNEIVVRFKKSLLNLSAIDRKSFTAGTLSQFVKPELLQRLNDSTSLIWDDFITYKIHKGATSNDTISCTRLGDTISIDPFWSVLVVELSGKLRMEGIIDELTQINGVENVQFNYIYKTNSVPNDPAYINGYQLGFHPNSIYPNSDINVIGAWNLLEDKGYTIGSNNVKVGIFDYLIDYSHAGFSGTNGINGSKIKYGKNYHNGNQIQDEVDLAMGNNHGTSVAGIIGANRNNGIGIAGISGGDSQLDPSNGGVSLYSIGVFSNNGGNATSDLIIEALDESSLATNTGYGNGINIGNHSYGTSNILNSPSLFDKEVQLAFEESWRQGVINIVARGNNGGVNSAEYPACYDDKFLINVVASGTDGKRKGISNGDYSDWQSSYGIADNPPSPGCHVDIMAPGVFELVSSTVNTDRILTYVEQNAQNDSICKIPFADQDNNMFSCFRGTSAATPHVTGAVSLMYSAHDPVNNSIYKNKLATEDVEHILEKTTYKTPNEYGLEDGYGLVNVEEAVKQSILPYSVYHLNLKLSNADIVEEAGIYQANNIRILKSHPGATPPYEKLGGPFTKKIRYRVKWNINFTPENGQIIDWWKLEARTNGGQPNGQLNSTNHWIMGNNNFYVSDGNSNATLGGNLNVNLNNTVTGTVEAYYYKFINTNPYYEQTLPANPNLDIHYTISLHLKGDDDLSIQDNANLDNIIIYPNPSNSEIMIRNLPENIDKYNVYIFNTSGVLVDSKKIGNASDIIDISKLSNGIYLIHLEADNYNTTSKFIKQ